MNLLITGGNGFLGKNILPILKNAGIRFWAPDSKTLNLLDYKTTYNIIKSYRPDGILHLAAKCGGILANKNSPADFLRENTQMGLNVYETARNCNIKYVYTLGSVCAYPKFCPTPFKEEDIWNGPAEETNFPYGQAKRTLMMLGQTYRAQYGIQGAHLIPANMYGKFDHFNLVNSHVVPALIKKILHAKHHGSTVSAWGTGQATREFFYAEDAGDAITEAIIQKLNVDSPINLGTGYEISIQDLAELISKLTGYTGEINFTNEVSDGQPKRRLDTSKAKELLGWEAKTTLEDGLQTTIDWYQSTL